MILCNLKDDFRKLPLIDSGIESGYIEKCDNLNKLPTLIKNLANKKIEFHQNNINEIKKYYTNLMERQEKE